jgi:hypothetical protein
LQEEEEEEEEEKFGTKAISTKPYISQRERWGD